ncbi:hypothetical protein C0992_005778 [Termitomyces sp. T32_za158]|nr:hypothetical protein C0992_005778 [Termitomyces sp. T32_za158]
MESERAIGDTSRVEPRTTTAASANNVAMPTDTSVDAAELEAGVKVDSFENNGSDSELTDTEPDDDGVLSNTEPLPHVTNKDVIGTESQDEHAPDPQIQQEILSDIGRQRGQGNPTTLEAVPDPVTNEGSPNGKSNPEGESISREELLEYLRDRKLLKRLLDKHNKKKALAHHIRGGRAKLAPLSEELETLIRKVAEGSSKKDQYKPANKGNRGKTKSLKSTEPINQIAAKSALGRAFKRINRRKSPSPSDDDSSLSDSDLDSSVNSPEDESASDADDSSDTEEEPQRGRNSCKRSQSRKRPRTLIKPTPPEKYSGQADLRSFHKFLTHGTSYVKYGYVERRRQVIVLSEFLTGKAYIFYTQRVSINPEKWDLQKFLTELFNYCFPIDFRNQQRTKLNNFSQGTRSVREYVSDLEELFTIVGADSKRAKVVKLFNGFCALIRKALLREHLNPEVTSWKTMIREAEYQEMAENVETRDANQSGNSRHYSGHQNQDNHRGHGRKSAPAGDARSTASGGPHTQPASNPVRGNEHRHKSRASTPYQSQKSKGNAPRHSESHRTLSQEEKEELKAAGRCYICQKEGHFSRNCPDKSRSTYCSGKPPGIGANSVRFSPVTDVESTEQLRVDCLGVTARVTCSIYIALTAPNCTVFGSRRAPLARVCRLRKT